MKGVIHRIEPGEQRWLIDVPYEEGVVEVRSDAAGNTQMIVHRNAEQIGEALAVALTPDEARIVAAALVAASEPRA